VSFNETFLKAASAKFDLKSVKDDFEIARGYIVRALEKCADKAGLVFNPADAKIYIHGSYANQTNIYFPSSVEIMVELKKTDEFDPESFIERGGKSSHEKFVPGYRIINDFFISASLGFTPRDFKNLLFESLVKEIGAAQTGIQNSYGAPKSGVISQTKNIVLENIGKLKHTVEITPGFSFEYNDSTGEKFKGILLYDENVEKNIVSFPVLHAQNGKVKDDETNGNFKRLVRLFKTLNAIYSREFSQTVKTKGYFIECILYNVPNNLFLPSYLKDSTKNSALTGGELTQIFKKVLNYLLNCQMDGFTCQNNVWPLFLDAKEFWQVQDAKSFLENIVRLYDDFPITRELL